MEWLLTSQWLGNVSPVVSVSWDLCQIIAERVPFCSVVRQTCYICGCVLGKYQGRRYACMGPFVPAECVGGWDMHRGIYTYRWTHGHIHLYMCVVCGYDSWRHTHCVHIGVKHIRGLCVRVQISSVNAKPSVSPVAPLAPVHKTPCSTLKAPLVSQGKQKKPESLVALSSPGSMTPPSYRCMSGAAGALRGESDHGRP